jgi:anti-anti-sigma factor
VSLQISIRQSGEVTILDLRGRATLNDGESESLEVELQKLAIAGVKKLLLNLAELRQVDSSGISVIVRTYVSLRDNGGSLKLLKPTSHVLTVFNALHLLEAISSFQDESAAVASFKTQSSTANP